MNNFNNFTFNIIPDIIPEEKKPLQNPHDKTDFDDEDYED